MELSDYLRPHYAKRQQKKYLNRLKEELFSIYSTNLGHQLYDQHESSQLSLPVDPEGLGCDDYLMEDRLYQIFEQIDGTAVAKKLVALMNKAGWKLNYYCEDGRLMIEAKKS